MQKNANTHLLINYLISAVWLINGFLCKVLNLVPRHQKIVSAILGDEYAGVFTRTIGLAEVFMAIWIFSGFKSRINSVMQIIIIAVMNVLEFIFVPHLLLFGRLNAVLALLFILLIYLNEFVINKKPA